MATKRRCRSISAPYGYYCSQMQCRLNLLKGNGAIKKAVRRMSDDNLFRNPIKGTIFGGIPVRSTKSDPSHSSSAPERSSSSRSSRSTHIFRLPSPPENRRSFHLKLSSTPVMQLPKVGPCKNAEKKIFDEEQLRYLYPNAKPKDLYFINIQGQCFSKVDKSLRSSCVNVIAIDAGENNLDLESFRHFPNLKELLIPLNNIKQINIKEQDFRTLSVLDLSCNFISPTAIFALGHLNNLNMLDLSCNNLQHLPIGLQPGSFSGLDTLILDHNLISDPTNFKSLARLQRLRTLSLKNNEITHLPFVESKFTHRSVKREMEKLFGIEDSPTNDNGLFPDPLQFKLKQAANLPTSSHKKIPCTYLRDEKNTSYPFPQLQQLNLANNKIKDVSGLYAVRTWRMMQELVIVGNRVASLSSRRLDKIKEFIVSSISINHVQFSHRVYDALLDPFHNEGLLGKFLSCYNRDEEFCECHKKDMKTHEEDDFNLDVTSATPKEMKTLPLPNQRLCRFKPQSYSQSFSQTKKSKLRSDSAALLAHTWRNIGDHVAPSTLPSTLRTTKIALQQALLHDFYKLAKIQQEITISSNSKSSADDQIETFPQNMRRKLLARFEKH